MPRFSWKSKEGYERFKDRVEGELGHKLVDTLETWVSNKYTKKSKHLKQFVIEYAKDSGNVPACN